MRRVEIVPQEVLIAAPLPLVFELISSVDQPPRQGNGSQVTLITNEGDRVLVAFTARGTTRQTPTIKEMQARPPDRLLFRHVSGPTVGAVETIELHVAGLSTRVVLNVILDMAQDSAHRLQKLRLEQSAQDYLRNIKAVLEDRVHPLQSLGTAPTVLVPVPALGSEGELLEAVDAQEEAEWGHAGHGRGVARVAVSLAEAVMLPERHIEAIHRAALLHDAGKIALDSQLWGSRSTLNAEQRAMMEAHPQLGYELTARLGLPEIVRSSILYHHERWDGKGYPNRLRGEAIPLRARILSVAESCDSMLRATYRRACMSPEQVSAALDAGASTAWDPMLARKAARIVRGGKPHAS